MAISKISVIIPVKNGENFIAKCVDSILAQTLKEIEIIVVNDNSTDKTSEVLEEYIIKYNIKVINTNPSLGPGLARNMGLEVASGTYVHFIDADDILKDMNVYSNLYDYAIGKDTDIVVFDAEYRNYSTNQLLKCLSWQCPADMIMSSLTDKKILLTQGIFSWNKIYKLSFLKEKQIKFLSQKYDEDRYYHWLVIIKCTNIIYYKQICYVYMKRDNSLSNKKLDYARFQHIIIASESIKDFLLAEKCFDLYKRVFVLFYLQRYCRDYKKSYQKNIQLFYELANLVSWINIEDYVDHLSSLRYLRYKYLINKNYCKFNIFNLDYKKLLSQIYHEIFNYWERLFRQNKR